MIREAGLVYFLFTSKICICLKYFSCTDYSPSFFSLGPLLGREKNGEKKKKVER